MIRGAIVRPLLALAGLLMVIPPPAALACAACFGASDSDMARGMNMGILTLLIVVLLVLAGIASFFIYLAKRSALVAGAQGAADRQAETSNRVS